MMDMSLSKADKEFDIQAGTLRFLQPNYGLFECFATNSQGTSYSGINLTKHKVTDTPGQLQLIQGPLDLVVTENSDIRFSCQVQSGRPVAFSWSFNTKSVRGVRPDWRVERVSESQENLVIGRVTAEDVGTVGCLVSSDAVRLYQEGSIVIAAPGSDHVVESGREMSAARIVSNFSLTEYQMLEGESFSLDCEVEGWPTPSVTWNGVPGSELVLASLDKAQDGSSHTCQAKNNAGNDERTVTVCVYMRSSIADETGGTRHQHTVLGSELILECAFLADDNWVSRGQAQIRWEKDGAALKEGRFTIEASLGKNILRVVGVTDEDGGEYACLLTTPLDSASARWMVDIVRPASILLFEPEDKLVLAGTMAELPCEAGGRPTPAVTWFLNDTELAPLAGVWTIMGSGSLRLERVEAEQAGRYRCEVRNQFGGEERSLLLSVASPTIPLPGKSLNLAWKPNVCI